MLTDFKGELAALVAAFLWAASSVVYRGLGGHLPPMLLNFLKSAIAILFLLLTIWLSGATVPTLELRPVSFLLLIGVFGIGVGDTAYFFALNCLGARVTLLLETLAPPIAAFFARIFLGEQLTLLAWSGIFIVAIGVAWVISDTSQGGIDGRDLKRGLMWAILAELCQASGAILSRSALTTSSITSLWSTLLRLSAGTVCVLLLLVCFRRRSGAGIQTVVRSPRAIGIVTLASFGGTYLGIWLQQTALQFSPTGIAQTLSATSPLFVLPIVAALGEKISWQAILGAGVALAGVALLFLR